jgi:hypothetical protein
MRPFEVAVYAALVVSMIVLLALTVHLPAHRSENEANAGRASLSS